jgi:microcystin-dependent protein
MGYGLSVSSNIYVVGFSSAAKYYGDGSSLTGVQTGGSISTVTIDALPIGTFIQYGSTTAPDSYLYCNGTSYSTTTYSALYAVIGYKYGGSGANFTCDFRGMFARGLDTTGTIDSEARVIGSSETDTLQGHAHAAGGDVNGAIGTDRTPVLNGTGVYNQATTGAPVTTMLANVNGTPRTGNETRPKNIAVAVMVKYQNPVVNYNGLTSSNTWSGSNTFTGPVVGIARSSTTASIPGTTGTNTTFGACVNGSALTITTQGNPIMVIFTGTATNSISNNGTLANIRIDGSLPSGYGTNDAIAYCDSVAGVGGNCAFTFVTDSLSAGSHSVCLVLRTQWAATWTLLHDYSNGYPRMTIMNIAQ